ncbi:MAG TPA: flagellar export protein FliJ [Candidatus Sulfotelmatobacter sp.]|nr:flagellar export protein FliJ [Candidatus Sulfotelmatobacter sp.]
MRFRFRLDPVLQHRERVERERAGDHARMLAAQLAAEAARDDLIGRRDGARDRLIREHATLDVVELRATYVHLDYLDRAIVGAQQKVATAKVDTEQARLKLVDAARDRQVLDTLKERRREAFALEENRVEQRELDDLNARLFERTAPEGTAS